MIPATELHRQRQNKLRHKMIEHDVPALLILDPVNILYATGATNMTLFTMRTPSRYLLLFAEGPVILFDFFGCEHLSKDLKTIDHILPAKGLCFTSSSGKVRQNSTEFATVITDLMWQACGNDKRLAIDRFPYNAVDALRQNGLILSDADEIFSATRRHKLDTEIEYMYEAMQRVENAVRIFQDTLEPETTEVANWASYQKELIANEGMYVTTRLVQSGERTYPYFQECSNRVVKAGELVCLDTDSVGYNGYAVDFSRTFIAGDKKPSNAQRMLYQKSFEQLHWNIDAIKPGMSFLELAEKAWKVPTEYNKSRYYCIAHGLGMSGEYPNIPYLDTTRDYPLDGHIEDGMILCIESYVGSEKFGEGVKLEQQLLIRDNAVECMSNYPFNNSFL